MNAKLNKRERRAAQLLAHYATCERLAAYLYLANRKEQIKTACGGYSPDAELLKEAPPFDGKKISVALWKAERLANEGATAYCNGERFKCARIVNGKERADTTVEFDFPGSEKAWGNFQIMIQLRVQGVFGKIPPGFFVNGDPRGYALKIDNENPEGLALIRAVGLHTDWGGYGILSHEITGD